MILATFYQKGKQNKTKPGQYPFDGSKCGQYKCKSIDCHWIVSSFCNIWWCFDNKVMWAAKKVLFYNSNKQTTGMLRCVHTYKKYLFETHLLISVPPQLHYQNRRWEETNLLCVCSRTGRRNTNQAHNEGHCLQCVRSHSQNGNSWAWTFFRFHFFLS